MIALSLVKTNMLAVTAGISQPIPYNWLSLTYSGIESPDTRRLIAPNPVPPRVLSAGSATKVLLIYVLVMLCGLMSLPVGHFAKDCPDGGGPMTCRNCG